MQTVLLLDIQCGNLAREGLRTLVVAKKILTEEQYQDFEVLIFLVIFYWNDSKNKFTFLY